jgi:CheY-like chemotaxis protein
MNLAIPLILVIDDDEQVRNFLKTSLTRSGYGVWDAACGDLAARILGERRIDLIVGDAGRIDPDGENTLRKLRRAQPGIKILAMTGRFPVVSTNPAFVSRRPRFPIMEIAVLKARLFLSADATLPKPVSADLLIETAKKLLGGNASRCRCAASRPLPPV